MHAGVVGQLAALLVPGAGHSEDAEVVQDAAAAMTPGHEGGGTGHGIQPSGLEILILGCWAGQWTRSWVGRCGTLPGSPADSPLLELSTNLR